MLPGNSVIFRDTVVVISLPQMDSVNSTFIWNDQLRATADTLKKTLAAVYHLAHIADSSQQQQLLIAAARITDRDNLTASQGILIKQQQKEIRRLRTKNTILGISTGIFAIAAIVLAILP